METSKEIYRKFCKGNSNVPIFLQPFWLDIVAENWQVILEQENNNSGEVLAALPFCLKGNIVTKRIYLPDVSFYQSIFFTEKTTEKQQQKIATTIFKKLPFILKSYFKFIPEYNKINLTVLGFKQEVYTTYILQNSASYILSKHHQRQTQKAIKLNYQIEESQNLNASYHLIEDTFLRKKIKSKINFDKLEKLQMVLKKHHCGQILDCKDSHKNILATLFFVEDSRSVYYLFSGYNMKFKNSGAITFLLNHVILRAFTQNKTINFCGSSNKNIANYFEGFGAKTTELNIWKRGISI